MCALCKWENSKLKFNSDADNVRLKNVCIRLLLLLVAQFGIVIRKLAICRDKKFFYKESGKPGNIQGP